MRQKAFTDVRMRIKSIEGQQPFMDNFFDKQGKTKTDEAAAAAAAAAIDVNFKFSFLDILLAFLVYLISFAPKRIRFLLRFAIEYKYNNKNLIPELVIQRRPTTPVLPHGRRPVDVAALERARRGGRRGPARRAHDAALLLLAAF